VHHELVAFLDFLEEGINALGVDLWQEVLAERQEGEERGVCWGQMRQLLVSSCVSIVLTVLNSYSHFVLNLLIKLNSQEIQRVYTVVVEPRLCDVEVNDGLAKVFQNELYVGCVVFYKKGLVMVDFDFGQFAQNLVDLLHCLRSLWHWFWD
jgi:hypothetical protein